MSTTGIRKERKMITVLDSMKIHKVYRWFGLLIEKRTFCLTLLWYFKERYDDGVGLFRITFRRFVEYQDKYGIKIESLGFSWKKLRNTV